MTRQVANSIHQVCNAIITGKGGNMKGRSKTTYQNKERRLRKFWEHCPKLQKRTTLDQWLTPIKRPNEKAKERPLF